MKPSVIVLISVLVITILYRSISNSFVRSNLVTTTIIQSDVTACAHPDYEALVELYNATNGPGWTRRINWLDTCDVCLWYGVRCNDQNRVIQLDLSRNGLNGPIPDQLYNLALESLGLASNSLSGVISPQIRNLSETIQEIHFGNNNLSGILPGEIGDLTLLKSLILENNMFSGSLPPEIGNLKEVEYFYCGGNLLSVLPPEIGEMTNLKELALFFGQFTGELPGTLGNLQHLEILLLENNNFYGEIPQEFENLSSLQGLYLGVNKLTGKIPPFLGNLSNLHTISLYENQFSGTLPAEIAALSKLTTLEFSDNNLQGCFPESYRNICGQTRIDNRNNPCFWQGSFSQFCSGVPCSFSDYTLVALPSTQVCAGSTTTLVASGGNSYYWSTGATNSSINIIPLTDTWYYLTVTTDKGCTRIDSIFMEVFPVPTATYASIAVSKPGGNDGAAMLSVNGGQTPYSYFWSTGATTAAIQNLSAGMYDFTITDANGCQDQHSVIINEPECQPTGTPCNDNDSNTYDDTENGLCQCRGIACPDLVIGLTIVGISCHGDMDGSATVNPSGGVAPYLVQWSNGASGSKLDLLAAGEYSVTVSDVNGCASVSPFSIVEPPQMTATFDVINESFPGAHDGSIDISMAGGVAPYRFQWSHGDTSKNVKELEGDDIIYRVTITDNHGCEITNQITLTTGCQTSGAPCSDEDPNTYDDQLDDDCQCSGKPCPLIDLNFFKANISCHDQSDGNARVIPTGGRGPYSILWSNGATTSTVDDLSPGNYQVTVTDGSGCKQTQHFTITEPEAMILTLSTKIESYPEASDGGIDLEVSGGTYPFSYRWSTGAITQDLTGLTGNATPYYVTVTDANACVISDSTFLKTGCRPKESPCDDGDPTTFHDREDGDCQCNGIPCPSFNVQISVIDVTCAGNQNGSILLHPTAGQVPYTYHWEGGKTQNLLSNLEKGKYLITITDAIQCTEVISVQIDEPAALKLESTVVLPSPNISDGSIKLKISGGSLPYVIQWEDGSDLQVRTDISWGSYQVTVTDVHNCILTDSFILSQCPSSGMICDDTDPRTFDDKYDQYCTCKGIPCPPLTIKPQLVHLTCFGDSTGSAFIDTVGLHVSQMHWSTGGASNHQSELHSGMYEVSISHHGECLDTISFKIEEPEKLILSLFGSDETSFNANNGTAGIEIKGGIPPYTVQWSNGSLDFNLENLKGNKYYAVTLSDALGCRTHDSIYIAQFVCANLQSENFVAMAFEGENCAQGKSLSIEGGSSQYIDLQFSLDGIVFQQSPIFLNLPAGIYHPMVKDQTNGCAIILEPFEIGLPPEIDLSVVHPSSCLGSDGAILTLQSSYELGLSELGPWFEGAITGLKAGLYQVYALKKDEKCPFYAGDYHLGRSEPGQDVISVLKSDVLCGSILGKLEITPMIEDIQFSIDRGNHWYSNWQFFEISPGEYEILVRSTESCVFTHSLVSIKESQPLDIQDVLVKPPSDCRKTNGSLRVSGKNIAELSADRGMTWIPGQVISNLPTGDFDIWIRDSSQNCLDSLEIMIRAEDTSLQLMIDEILHPSCTGADDGFIRMTQQGGLTTHKWTWSHGGQGLEQSGLKAGFYQGTITDSRYCENHFEVQLVDPLPVEVHLPDFDTNLYCQGEVVIIAMEDPELQYSWYRNGHLFANGQQINIISEGSYEVSGRDPFGCEDRERFSIQYSDQLFAANFLLSAVAVSGKPINAIEVSWPVPDEVNWEIEGGTIMQTFLNQATLVFDQPGDYEVILRAVKAGCMSIVRKQITVVEDNGQLLFPTTSEQPAIQLTLFPNPNLGNFNVMIELKESSDIQLRIYDEQAILVYNARIPKVQLISQNITLDGASPGLYTLLVQSDTSWRTVSFIIE